MQTGILDAELNYTFIVLIPKVSHPTKVTEFRPISLCNVLYKLIAKVLANRLKHILPSIISQQQSAFLPGRLITDNVLVAYEALHTMDTRLKGKKGFMAIKLDMSKAYDRVEWNFLEAIMRKMGFATQWIDLIMACVRSVSYSILVNGVPQERIFPSRGLRQGDPLSPYLFLLCAEGLSSLLSSAEQRGTITGLPVARGGTHLSHLFFADDSLLFCRANFLEWCAIHDILEVYERASGQQINRDKTAIFFSRNTKQAFRDYICSIPGFSVSKGYEKYLGLPSLVGRAKRKTFADIKGRVRSRLQGWKEKFLSQAGREILIKAVIQAMPTYSMSVFQLPKTLCRELNVLMNKFFWGHQEKDSRILWQSWKQMGLSKHKGGMGFRDLECFNLAL
jgi:hypothetical protein